MTVFNNRRATFYLQLGEAAVKAWKERVGFPTDPDDVFAAPVTWLSLDKYLMTLEGLAGICISTSGMARFQGCEGSFVVDAEDFGNTGQVRAILGHVSFASTKVCLRGKWPHWSMCSLVHDC